MARYDKLRKLDRNRLLIEYYQAHPDVSLREIGELFNISYQRVWEIIQKYSKQGELSNAKAG